MRQIDLQFVKDTLLELDPTWEGSEPDESYQTALVLVSALVCGSDIEGLAEFTQLPRTFVETIRHRMIRAELWTESDAFYAHWVWRREPRSYDSGMAGCSDWTGPRGAKMG